MKQKYLSVVAAFLLLSINGCNSCGNSEKKCHPVIGKECNGETVKLKPGEKTMIKLTENPTTGYQWSFTNSAPQSCQVITDKFIAPTSGLMGAPGCRQVMINAVAPGTSVFDFKYARSWEKNQAPADKFTVTIEVSQ